MDPLDAALLLLAVAGPAARRAMAGFAAPGLAAVRQVCGGGTPHFPAFQLVLPELSEAGQDAFSAR